MSFINKKILLPILICLLSFTTHAFWEKTSTNKIADNSVLVQKAQESGVLFSNNNEQYQLIADGRAVRQTTSNTASLSTNQNNTLWSGSRGPYQVFINDSTTQTAQTASASTSSNDYNQIAYNPRTGNVAILTGKIIVKLTNGVTAESIASNHNIILSANYPHINTAFFTVNTGQDIFSIAQLIAQDVNVVSAEIDAIEHFAQPNQQSRCSLPILLINDESLKKQLLVYLLYISAKHGVVSDEAQQVKLFKGDLEICAQGLGVWLDKTNN